MERGGSRADKLQYKKCVVFLFEYSRRQFGRAGQAHPLNLTVLGISLSK